MATSDPTKTDKLKTVFVISPIEKLDDDGIDFAKLCLEQIIKPAAKDCGGYAVPERADDHHKPGSVTGKIVSAIIDADVCVADLTGRNPNVMYEVAIAHAAGKPVILLQQEAGGPPFDFADERVIHYGLRVDLANRARGELVGHFKAAHEDEEDEALAKTMNPVRQLFAELMTKAKASEPQKALLDELQAVRLEVREALSGPSSKHSSRAQNALVRETLDLTILDMARRLALKEGILPPESFERLRVGIRNAEQGDKQALLELLQDLEQVRSLQVSHRTTEFIENNIPPF